MVSVQLFFSVSGCLCFKFGPCVDVCGGFSMLLVFCNWLHRDLNPGNSLLYFTFDNTGI